MHPATLVWQQRSRGQNFIWLQPPHPSSTFIWLEASLQHFWFMQSWKFPEADSQQPSSQGAGTAHCFHEG
jgi:hypothetical protein